jgi:hypothetical protein
MLRTIVRLEKLAALRRKFLQEDMLFGSTAAHFARNQNDASECEDEGMMCSHEKDRFVGKVQEKCGIEDLDDAGPESGPQFLSSITLAASPGIFDSPLMTYLVLIIHYQKDSIQKTSISCLSMSTSPIFHSRSNLFFILCDTQIVLSRMMLKHVSSSAARFKFFIQQ